MSKAKPSGRPSSYDQTIADEICERIATTPRGLDFICSSDDALPSPRTVHLWLNAHPDFLQGYLRARERQADLIFDECLEIADDVSDDTKTIKRQDGSETEVCNSEWISRSKLRVDTRMRMAGKLAPKKYGESVNLKHSGADGEGPVQIEDAAAAARISALLAAAQARRDATDADG